MEERTATAHRENTPRQAAFWKVSGSFLSKLLGFGRDVLIAKIFGATYVVDVTQLVENVLLNMVNFVTSPLSIPLIPELTRARLTSEQKYRDLLSSVLGLFSVIGIVLSAGALLFPGFLVSVFSGGFRGVTAAYAEYTYRWMAPLGIIVVFGATLKTALSVKKDFALLSFGDALMNVIVIGGLLLGARTAELPAVKTAAHCASALVLWLYFCVRERWLLLPRLRHWGRQVGSLLRQAAPLFIGSATDMLLTLIDRTMASFLPEGSIASLAYAQKIFLLPLGVWAVQITEASYPYIASAFALQDVEGGYHLARTALRRMLFFIVPATAGLLLLASPIVRIVYQRGAFTAQDTAIVARVLQGYLGVLLFSSVQYIQTRLFYARSNTMTPMIISLVSLGLNVGLNYLLGFVLGMGVYGLAVASSIAAFLSMVLMYVAYRRRYGGVGYGRIGRDTLKTGCAATAMAAVVWALRARISILPLIAIGFAAYMLAALLLREEDAVEYMAGLRNMLSHGSRKGS